MENNVLFVDDEVHILKAIKRGLIKEKYNKFFASSGSEALEILEREEIHVIVSDMKMPHMNGLELLTIVNDQYPEIVKIILSGYTQLQQIIVTINRINIYKFLTKPWDMENEFKAVLNSAIDLYNTKVENENLKKSLVKKNELYQKMIKSNSQKMDLMKNDFGFLEKLNKVLQNFYYLMAIKLRRGDLSDDKYQEELTLISHFYSQIIKMMPTKHDEFNINTLQIQLTKFLEAYKKEGNATSRIKVTSTNVSGVYTGNLGVLMFALTSIIYHYFDMDYYDEYDMIISEKERIDDEGLLIDLVILLRSKSNHVLEERIRLNTLMTFFVNLFESYEGVLSTEERSGQNLVVIKFPLKRKQDIHEEE